MTRINLLPAARVRTRRVRVRLAAWAAALCVVWIVAGSAIVFASVTPDGSNALARQRIAQVNQELAEQLASARRSAAEVGKMGAKLEVARALERRRDRSGLLVTLGELVGDEVALRRMVLSPNPDAPSVVIEGVGIDQAAVTGFMLRLESTGTLRGVELVASRRVTLGAGDAVDFAITATAPMAQGRLAQGEAP